MTTLAPHQTTVRSDCQTCRVRARSICGVLSPERLTALATIRRPERLGAGETLAWEGARSVMIATVREGLVKRSLLLGDGREQVVGLAYAGDMVGRPFAPVSDHSLTAIVPTILCLFPRTAFERFAEATPALEHAMLLQALDDLGRAQRHMLMLARMSAPQRIASFLLELAERGDRTVAGHIAIPLGRQQIGDLLGLSIETVSRRLRAFERAGFIGLLQYRTLVLHDRPALLALAGGGTDPSAWRGASSPGDRAASLRPSDPH